MILTRVLLVSLLVAVSLCASSINSDLLGEGYPEDRVFYNNGAEQAVYDPNTYRLYVLNQGLDRVDVYNLQVPSLPAVVANIDLTPYPGTPLSLALINDVLAVSISGAIITNAGTIQFFTIAQVNYLQNIGSVPVGAYPLAATFSNNQTFLLVANKGIPNDEYTQDPIGTLSVVSLLDDTGANYTFTTANINLLATSFQVQYILFDTFEDIPLPGQHRFFTYVAPTHPSRSQDLEPTALSLSADDATVYVVFQTNNVLAEVDLNFLNVTSLFGLSSRNFSQLNNTEDLSDHDGVNGTAGILFGNYTAFGLDLPADVDCFSTFVRSSPQVYCFLANTGAYRDYTGYSEVAIVADLNLNNNSFPNVTAIQNITQLGDLYVSTLYDDPDNTGNVTVLNAFGSRSFSIWTPSNQSQVYSSLNSVEKTLANLDNSTFNSDAIDNDSFDSRSVISGCEPNTILYEQIDGADLLFITLRQQGGFYLYNVDSLFDPQLVTYSNSRNFSLVNNITDINPDIGGLEPTSLIVIPAYDSPTGENLVVVTNTASSSVAVYRLTIQQASSSLVPPASASTVSFSVVLSIFALLACLLF